MTGTEPPDMPDRRIHAFRPDLADESLRGQVDAERYVRPAAAQVAVGVAALRTAPADDAPRGSELLFGERVDLFEERDGWAWVQNAEDGYVGYLRAGGLTHDVTSPTHRVTALRTFLYARPDLKSPALDLLSMNAPVTPGDTEGGFASLGGAGWIWAGHIRPLGEAAPDHAAVALQFTGTPYLWGGRSSLGLDCSALVQLALARCGRKAPRDSDMQAAGQGAEIPFDGDEAVLRRGDLVFWPGHVGIWIDGETFLHANATDMMVASAPLRDVARHIRKTTGAGISIIRRP